MTPPGLRVLGRSGSVTLLPANKKKLNRRTMAQAQLSNDLVNTQNAAVNTVLPLTSANSNGVSLPGVSSGDFTVQTLIDKLNELINALRR